MIIIYTNKLCISRVLSSHFPLKYPDKDIVFIHSFYFVNVSFDYPKQIKWKDFPYLTSPQFNINEMDKWKPLKISNDTLMPVEISLNDVIHCEKIIYAADPEKNDVYLFSMFIESVFKQKIENTKIEAMKLMSLNDIDIDFALNNLSNFHYQFKQEINEGKIYKYFDYNFNFNSFALFGKVYQSINQLFGDESHLVNSIGKIFISKSMLQLLYLMKEKELENINYNEGSLFYAMSHWKGTGKYTNKVSLGSAASRASIIENLLKLKLIISCKNKIILTTKGKQFLSSLPKDCCDYDLPFRIKLWSEQPFEESKVKIDNYLNHYFKKIKNKLKSQ